MGTLERVVEMQGQGLNDNEISTKLQTEGVSPKEIDDSINQAKIKNAVSPPDPSAMPPTQPPAAASQAQVPEGMQASITDTAPAAILQQPQAAMPPTQPQAAMHPTQAPQMQPPAAPNPEVYPPQDQDAYYTQTPQAYPAQDYYAPQGGVDIETISEIAEQVATEKLSEFTEKTGDLVSFKNTIQEKVGDIDDRLKRIEGSIDKLQQAVIGKIGEFGESNAMIHKDLDNLHGTVSKLMNPLIDNVNELRKIAK